MRRSKPFIDSNLEDTMTKRTASSIIPAVSATEVKLAHVREEVSLTTRPVLAQITALIVTDDKTYTEADAMRSRIRLALKSIDLHMSSILDPINEARTAALKLKHELADPLTEADNGLVSQMRQYKLAEARQIAAEQAERDRKARELAAEAYRKQQAAESAKTKQMQARLQNQAAELERKAEEVQAALAPIPVQVASSITRKVLVWRVSNMMDLVKSVAAGDVPLDVLQVNSTAMLNYFRMDNANKDAIRTWPGITVEDDVQIVRR